MNKERSEVLKNKIADLVISGDRGSLMLEGLLQEFRVVEANLPQAPGYYLLRRDERSQVRFAMLDGGGHWYLDGTVAYSPAEMSAWLIKHDRVPEMLYTKKATQVMAQALAIQAVEYAATRDPT